MGLKDIFYSAIIVALGTGFAAFVHHERVIGANTVKASDAKAVAADIQHNTKVEVHAQAAVTQIAKAYANAVSAPRSAHAPHLWVRNSCRGGTSGNHAGTPGRPDGAPDVPAAIPSARVEADAIDFGPPLDKLYHDADAQVTGLQDYIKACQRAGLCAR